MEQHADEASSLVLAYVYQNPEAYAKFLKIMMVNINTQDGGTCDAIIKSGKAPVEGSFFIPHHSYCYRIYNYSKMAQRLARENNLKTFTRYFLQKTTR